MSRLTTKQRRARLWRREFQMEWTRLLPAEDLRYFTAADLAEWSVSLQRDPASRGGLGRIIPSPRGGEGEPTP